MINIRESEIRDEALTLAVVAYDMVSEMPHTISTESKNRVIDDSFRISSSIADVFKSNQNDHCEVCVIDTISKLNEIKQFVIDLSSKIVSESNLVDSFLHITEELHVELTELLSAVRMLNTESYPPKLETTCF